MPAKINLQLAVGAPRPDGYHDVVSVYQAVGLTNTVTVRAAEAGVRVVVLGEGADELPTGTENLAVRAVAALAEATGVAAGVALRLHRSIPVAAGLAGGSADAAGALVACDALWGTRLSRADLVELAAGLGADVPFALLGGTAVGVGTGARLTPALSSGRFHWVLALADGGLSTPAVYAECDRLRAGTYLPEPRLSDGLMAALRSGDAEALGATLSNDLQRAAVSLRPGLGRTLAVGEEYGALGTVVSGSGPTCAFLAAGEEHALDLAVALSASGVCRTVRRADGPVHGARTVDEEPDPA